MTRSKVTPFRSSGRFSRFASAGEQTGVRSALNSGAAISPGKSPSPSLMPQVQSSLNGSASPPVAKRTSMSGACFWKSASRGMSQRIANVGPTPTVSTRALPIAVT